MNRTLFFRVPFILLLLIPLFCLCEQYDTFQEMINKIVLLEPPNHSFHLISDPLTFSWQDELGNTRIEHADMMQISVNSLSFFDVGNEGTYTFTEDMEQTYLRPYTSDPYHFTLRGVNAFQYNFFDEVITLYFYSDEVPVLIAPLQDEITCVYPPEFQWESIVGATSYRLELSTDSIFSDPEYSFDEIPIASFQPTDTAIRTNEYFWRVRAEFESETEQFAGPWSETPQFMLYNLPAPAHLSPADGTGISQIQPTIAWEPWEDLDMDAGDTYLLQFGSDSDFGSLFTETNPPIAETPVSVLDLSMGSQELLPGIYYWRVRVQSGSCKGPWSDLYSFAVCPAENPTLSDLKNVCLEDGVSEIIWEGYSHLDYEVAFGIDDSWINPDGRNRFSARVEELEVGKTYAWRIRTVIEDYCTLEWSLSNTFQVIECGDCRTPKQAPELCDPMEGAYLFDQGNVTFYWTDIDDDHGGYRIEIASDSDFEELVAGTPALVSEASFTPDSETPVDGNHTATYFWRVRAVDTCDAIFQEDGPWSSVYTFDKKEYNLKMFIAVFEHSNYSNKMKKPRGVDFVPGTETAYVSVGADSFSDSRQVGLIKVEPVNQAGYCSQTNMFGNCTGDNYPHATDILDTSSDTTDFEAGGCTRLGDLKISDEYVWTVQWDGDRKVVVSDMELDTTTAFEILDTDGNPLDSPAGLDIHIDGNSGSLFITDTTDTAPQAGKAYRYNISSTAPVTIDPNPVSVYESQLSGGNARFTFGIASDPCLNWVHIPAEDDSPTSVVEVFNAETGAYIGSYGSDDPYRYTGVLLSGGAIWNSACEHGLTAPCGRYVILTTNTSGKWRFEIFSVGSDSGALYSEQVSQYETDESIPVYGIALSPVTNNLYSLTDFQHAGWSATGFLRIWE